MYSKKSLIVASTVLTLLISVVPSPLHATACWTVMVYLDGDNNLEPAAIDDLNEMEAVGSTNKVNVVVQFDRHAAYDNTNGNWTTCKRYYVTKDANGYDGVIDPPNLANTRWTTDGYKGGALEKVHPGPPYTMCDVNIPNDILNIESATSSFWMNMPSQFQEWGIAFTLIGEIADHSIESAPERAILTSGHTDDGDYYRNGDAVVVFLLIVVAPPVDTVDDHLVFESGRVCRKG